MTSGHKKVILSKNSEEVASARYFGEGEDWEKLAIRNSVAISQPELPEKRKEYSDKFGEIIYNMDFLPAGRILRNAGRPRGTLLNCFVLPCNDSIEEIGQFYKDSLILWSEGGGVGCNFSALRPNGDAILGKGGKSSGLVSFLEGADYLAARIESGGGRRAAGLALVDINHPEVIDFINCKMVDKKLSYFNISVAINEDFLTAVELNKDWEFKFKQRSYGKVKAREIWDLIIKNMVNYAEPGLINWDNLTKNNSYYYDPVVSTNPCGEATLAPYEACDLGSINLPNFITGNINTNWKKLENVVKLAVRFLDNVLECNKYPIKEIDIKCHASRRIGLGIMGLSEYLFCKQLRYGSQESLNEIERLMRFIRDTAYTASIELSMEKGAFAKFDPVHYCKAMYIRSLPPSLRMDIKEKGVRNVTLFSIAPTGSISLLANVSSGIEPLPFKAYVRKDRVSERLYIHPKYREFIERGEKIPDWLVDSHDISPKDHFEVQRAVQTLVDGSVSKTLNLPKGTKEKDLSKLLLLYMRDLKGATVYVDGSREGQILNSVEHKEVLKYIKEEKTTSELSDQDVQCANGNCEWKPPKENS